MAEQGDDEENTEMTRHWQYPIYLIQHGGGYASIVDGEEGGSSHSLVLSSTEEKAMGFMAACGIMGALRELKNDREFGWLLKSLQAPAGGVVFDPSPTIDEQKSAYRLSVRELLDDHLTADNSPWNYPVYVVARDNGFVSIAGVAADGGPLTAVGFFTSEERIATYLEATGEEGTVCAMQNLDEARSFLNAIAPQAAAVALNPTVREGQRSAKHCFAIEILLEKYLVDQNSETTR